MNWKAILNNACKCSTSLKGPSSQWEGSYPLFMFGKDCLTTWIIFVVIKSGANLTTNPADWNNTLACIPCNSIQYHAISNITQYHTIQGNLPKHIGVLRTTFLYGNTTIITGASFVDTTDNQISHLTFDLQSDKTYFWNPLLLFINSDTLIKLDMRPLFNDFFISQIFW